MWNLLDLTPEGRGDWYRSLNYSPRDPGRLLADLCTATRAIRSIPGTTVQEPGIELDDSLVRVAHMAARLHA
ncbi:MAG: hypothetical protein WAW53_06235, partial [Candidatus Dormiibacterota bacterium]